MSLRPIPLVIGAALLVGGLAPAALAAGHQAVGGNPALPAPPDLDGWEEALAVLRPPAAEPGTVAIREVSKVSALSGGALRFAQATPDWRGDAVVVESGVHGLEQVARAAGRPDLLRCRSSGCELRAPLLVGAGAGMAIAGTPERPLRLRLHQESGAFVINAGQLHIDSAEILGWSSAAQAPATTDGAGFRPYLAGFGASDTTIQRSRLHHLGFMGAKAYGLTLSSQPRVFPGAQPAGRIFASGIEELSTASIPTKRMTSR